MFDEPFGVRVVFAPEMDKLGKMVGTKDGPIPGEVVKVVHDDSNEEVEDEEGADNEEADEVGVGNVGAATSFLSGIVRCFVTWSIFPEDQYILYRSVPKDQGNISEEIISVGYPGTQSSMISCQASPVADRKRTKNAIVKDWKLLFL